MSRLKDLPPIAFALLLAGCQGSSSSPTPAEILKAATAPNTPTPEYSTPVPLNTLAPTIINTPTREPQSTIVFTSTPQPPEPTPTTRRLTLADIPEVKTLTPAPSPQIATTAVPTSTEVPKPTIVPTPQLEKINAQELSIIWERQTEVPHMSPKFSLLADENFVYASSGDRFLAAFRVENGQQAWVWKQPRSLDFTYDTDLFDPNVLVATYGDHLWIIDKKNGLPKFNPIAYRSLKIGGESIQPFIFDKVISFMHHIQTGEMTTAVDKSTGHKLWTIKGRMLHTHPDANLAIINKSSGFLSSLYYIDLETGKDIGQVVEQEKGETLDSYYEKNSGHLIVSNNNKYKVLSVDFDNKKVAWVLDEDKIKGYKTFVNKDPKDENLYVKSKPDQQSGEKLTAINKKNGKIVWEVDLGKSQKQALQILGIKEGVVIIKDSENFTTVLIDTMTGTRREVGKTRLNSLVGVHDKRVLVGIGGYDRHTFGVYGIDLTTGQEVWRRAGQQHDSLASVLTGGKVFFGKLASEKLQIFSALDGKLLKEITTGEAFKMVVARPDLVLVNGRKIYAIKA